MSRIKTVIKRNGTPEAFSSEKLNKWAEYATQVGGSWSDIALLTFKRLNDNCTTQDIHETMIDVCLEKQSIEYSRVAARLEFAEILKGMQYVLGFDDSASFKTIIETFEDLNLWDGSYIPAYNPRWEKWFEQLKQKSFEYWQIKQWVDKYAIRIQDVVIETPVIGMLGIALSLFGDTDDAFEYAQALVEGQINLPTPALNGCRNGDFDTISCCVISGGDTTESIGVAEHIAYRMTAKKAGIGLELTTRSKGDSVKGGRVKHLGKWPLYKHVDRAVKCMCYDDETEVLTNNGFKLFRNLEPEDLVAQVHDDRSLTFVTPSEYVALPFKGTMYHFHKKGVDVRVTDNHQMAHRKINYDDKNRQMSDGYEFIRADEFIPGRTTAWDFGGEYKGTYKHLTDFDRLQIAYQADGSLCENTTTVNSYRFSLLKERKKEELFGLLDKNGLEYHHTKNNNTGYSAVDRETDNGTYKIFRIKKPEFELHKNLDWVYDRDWTKTAALEFFEELRKWDGDFKNSGNQIVCYNTAKKDCADAVQYVATVANLRSSIKFYDGCYRTYVYDIDCVTGEATKVDTSEYDGIVYCVTVPTHVLVVRRNGYTNVCGNTQITRGGNATVTALAIDPEIENILLWKSQRIDIEQRIDKLDYSFGYNDAFLNAVVADGDWYLFSLKDAPKVYDGFYHLGAKEYDQLVEEHINSGIPHKKVSAREIVKTYLTVRQETGRFYDINLTRVNTHTPFIDTIRQSNLCMEICLPTKGYESMAELYSSVITKGETAFCSLSAINAMRTPTDKYERIAELTLRAVDIMIDKAPMLSKSMKADIMRRRSVGIGIIGLAGYLYERGLDYDGSEAALNATQELAERHYYYLLKASQKMAKESGIHVDGINTAWLPIDTSMSKSISGLDWEELRSKPRKHSVLVAHMPTESSSLLSSAPNGLYPVRRKVLNKKSRKGLVQYICEPFNEEKHLSAWDVDNITLAKYYSRVQDYTDQAISADYYVSMKESKKLPMSQLLKEWVAHAKLGNKTKYYLNTNDYKGGSVQEELAKAAKVAETPAPTTVVNDAGMFIEDEGEDGCSSCKL